MSEQGTPDPSSPSQLRRTILSQAVADNVAEKEGKRPRPVARAAAAGAAPPHHAPARHWRWAVPVLAGIALATVVLGGFLEPSKSADRSDSNRSAERAGAGDGAGSGPVPAVSGGDAQPVIATPVFDAPKPIDFDVFSLAVERIVLDPGHGGEDTGTTGGGLTEKELTLDIAMRLRDQLEEQGFEVFMTRQDDTQISLRQRALQANTLRADLFVSIHINWIAQRTVRGLETYFLGAADDPALEALVRKENRGSGYSLADMKSLLEGIYTGVRQDESQQFASHVQRSLYRSLLRQNPQLADRGVKTAPFVVLVGTEMPAILAEVSCLSNEQEAKLLARPLYRQHIAEALSRGIRSYADEVHQSEAKGS